MNSKIYVCSILLVTGLLIGFSIGYVTSPKTEIDNGPQRLVHTFTVGNDEYVEVRYYHAGVYYYWLGKLLPNGSCATMIQGSSEVKP